MKKFFGFLSFLVVLPVTTFLDYIKFVFQGFFAGIVFLRAGMLGSMFRMGAFFVHLTISWGLIPGLLLWSLYHWGPLPGVGVLAFAAVLSPTQIWELVEVIMKELYLRPLKTWTRQSTSDAARAGIYVTFVGEREEFETFRKSANKVGLWFAKFDFEILTGKYLYKVFIIQDKKTLEDETLN